MKGSNERAQKFAKSHSVTSSIAPLIEIFKNSLQFKLYKQYTVKPVYMHTLGAEKVCNEKRCAM